MSKAKDSVIAAVRQDAWAFRFAPAEMRADKDVTMAAVQKDGKALQYADEKLQKDKAIVQTAVSQDGLAIEFADEDLKGDIATLEMAVKQNPKAISFAPKNLKNDPRLTSLLKVKDTGDTWDEEPGDARPQPKENGSPSSVTRASLRTSKTVKQLQNGQSPTNPRASRRVASSMATDSDAHRIGGCFGA